MENQIRDPANPTISHPQSPSYEDIKIVFLSVTLQDRTTNDGLSAEVAYRCQ